jgi:hypothetical protein
LKPIRDEWIFTPFFYARAQAALSGSGNVTVINPSTAADAINVTSRANKDAIIVLANSVNRYQ